MSFTIRLPEDAVMLIRMLNEAGFDAYAVGGCVRDSLLGKKPKDWDICTSAMPEQMQQVFAGMHVVQTGLKHGTLTVMCHHEPYEITTFRVDGSYADHRHPDSVSFVGEVSQDLARRDFTVNAMAWHPVSGLVDLFGGRQDLENRVLRCVGVPEHRFGEDALRILRALRFASVYDFTIEPATAAAVHALYPTIERVAGERIRVELMKLLCGPAAGRILREFTDVIIGVLPELAPCVGFDQKSPWHRYDVWEHIVRTVQNATPAEPVLRMTMLLHDSGKPEAFTLDEDGVGHARGHQKISAQKAGDVLKRLHMDNDTRDRILQLVQHHDIEITEELLRRRLSQFGEEALRQLLRVQEADGVSRGTADPDQTRARIAGLTAALDALIATAPCVTLKQLAVNGGDLVGIGYPQSPVMGQCLQRLLDQVVDGTLPNEKEALLAQAKAMLS